MKCAVCAGMLRIAYRTRNATGEWTITGDGWTNWIGVFVNTVIKFRGFFQTKRRMIDMKIAMISIMAGIMAIAAGCMSDSQQQELRSTVHTAILEYVENEGQARALEFIDQLVADGELGAANAEKIKDAIPAGIDRLREVMGELEQEAENE